MKVLLINGSPRDNGNYNNFAYFSRKNINLETNKRMMKSIKRVLLLGFVLPAVLTSCHNKQGGQMSTDEPQSTVVSHADSLLKIAMNAEDADRLSVLTDSLSALGQLSPIKADFHKGYVYRLRNDFTTATEYFSRIMEVEDPSDADFKAYLKAGVLLTDFYIEQYENEAALRTALHLLDKLKGAGDDKLFELKGLYANIGICQLRLKREAEADESFRKASEYTKKLISTDHVSHIDLYNGIVTYYQIVTAYFNADKTVESEPWVNLEDSVYQLFKARPEAQPFDVDYFKADILYNRMMIAINKGDKVKANRYYEEYKTTDYSKHDVAIINGAEYLKIAERYAESADNWIVLDNYLHRRNIEIDLDVIHSFLMPKMHANYMAGRKDSALRVAMQIYNAFDSAYTKQQEGMTAKLAAIYDTEGKERRIAEQQAEISQQRVIGLTIAIVFLTLAFIIYSIIRRRAAARLAEVKAAQERIESELRIARDIQMSMVPSVFPDREGLDVFAKMTPAKEVGGDLYGYVLQGDKFYFAIGDVSGKGVPASLFMAQATRLFRTLAVQGMMPAEICTRMNSALTEDNQQGMFVTFWLGLLDLQTGHLSFCNAGHNAPVIGGGEHHGDFLQMKANAPIGLWKDIHYEGEDIDTIKGRPFFLYTDGLNEAENLQQEQFGEDRMLDLLRQTSYYSSKQVIDSLTAEIEKHRDGAEPNDDLTMFCIHLN